MKPRERMKVFNPETADETMDRHRDANHAFRTTAVLVYAGLSLAAAVVVCAFAVYLF